MWNSPSMTREARYHPSPASSHGNGYARLARRSGGYTSKPDPVICAGWLPLPGELCLCQQRIYPSIEHRGVKPRSSLISGRFPQVGAQPGESSSRSSIAFATESGERGSTSNPVTWSSITSPSPALPPATTGKPAAAASTNTRPRPSPSVSEARVGSAKIWASRNCRGDARPRERPETRRSMLYRCFAPDIPRAMLETCGWAWEGRTFPRVG